MIGPPVVHVLAKLVVEEGVTVLVVCAVPEQHFRMPVDVVVTSIDYLKLVGEVERVSPHEEPMSRPLGTRGELARVGR